MLSIGGVLGAIYMLAFVSLSSGLLSCFRHDSFIARINSGSAPARKVVYIKPARKSRICIKKMASVIAAFPIAFGLWQQPALSSTSLPQKYDSFAPTYDTIDGGGVADALGLNELRKKAGTQVKGDVLEVAIGTCNKFISMDIHI